VSLEQPSLSDITYSKLHSALLGSQRGKGSLVAYEYKTALGVGDGRPVGDDGGVGAGDRSAEALDLTGDVRPTGV
jgi:hypothetical protein